MKHGRCLERDDRHPFIDRGPSRFFEGSGATLSSSSSSLSRLLRSSHTQPWPCPFASLAAAL